MSVAEGESIRKLKDTLKGIIEARGCECVGIDISVAAHASVLRIYIDTPDGVGHDECVAVSKAVTEYLDGCEERGESLFPDRYLVEVSSPGIERPLITPEHFRRFTGKQAAITLVGGKKLQGLIVSCDDRCVSFETGTGAAKETFEIRFEDIRHSNLLYIDERGTKKGKPGAGASK
jgi:ribosome maturation factor RimP